MQLSPKDIYRLEKTMPLLKINNITHLDLSGNRFAQETLERTIDAINNYSPNLQILKLNRTSIGGICQYIAYFLQSNKSVQELHLETNLISFVDMEFIFPALEENNYLLTLNLSKNDIYRDSMYLITNYIKLNRQLKSLMLNFNQINSRGFSEFAYSFKYNTNLKSVSVQTCNISFSKHETLCYDDFLSRLESLNISGNPLSDDCIDFLCKKLEKNQSIKNLCVSRISRFKYYDLKSFTKFVNAISVNNSIMDLEFTANGINNKMLEIFSQIFEKNHTLTHVNLDVNTFDNKTLLSLLDKLKTNNCIQKIMVGTNKFRNEVDDEIKLHEKVNALVFR